MKRFNTRSFDRWHARGGPTLLAWIAAFVLGGSPGGVEAQGAPGKPAAKGPAAVSSPISNWEDLIPPGWDPAKLIGAENLARVPEGSVQEVQLMQRMREVWDNAPTRAELQGAAVRIPGYVVPLDGAAGSLSEFLLVPYFGACIHSPPPPANQIIHVRLSKPQALRSMDAVWVSGTLRNTRQNSAMGISGYSVDARVVEPYKAGGR